MSTMEEAGLRALRTWLGTNLPGVVISERWPDPSKNLPPQAITVLRVGKPQETSVAPVLEGADDIHRDLTQIVTAAPAVDDASTIALLNDARAVYEAHRVNTGAHQAADVLHAVAAPVATNLVTAAALAAALEAGITAHAPFMSAHATADTLSAGRLAATSMPLAARANGIARAMNAHIVARVFVWRVGDVLQDVQLDVWAGYHPKRDELLAELVPLLHAPQSRSAPELVMNDGGVPRIGVLLVLGAPWRGATWMATVDFDFDAPLVMDTADSKRVGEFRAMYQGTMAFARLIRQQGSRIARLKLVERYGKGDPLPSPALGATLAWSSEEPGSTATYTEE
jgi:hypothetical protein